jgi:hypothetical protein
VIREQIKRAKQRIEEYREWYKMPTTNPFVNASCEKEYKRLSRRVTFGIWFKKIRTLEARYEKLTGRSLPSAIGALNKKWKEEDAQKQEKAKHTWYGLVTPS